MNPMADVIEGLQRQGWDVERADGTRRYTATPPNRTAPLVRFAAIDDVAQRKAAIAQLRRSGFVWPMAMPPPRPPRAPTPITIEVLPTKEEPPMPKQESSDAIFVRLKEARLYLDLATRERAEKVAALDTARKSEAPEVSCPPVPSARRLHLTEKPVAVMEARSPRSRARGACTPPRCYPSPRTGPTRARTARRPGPLSDHYVALARRRLEAEARGVDGVAAAMEGQLTMALGVP